jgi:hypothetical protein
LLQAEMQRDYPTSNTKWTLDFLLSAMPEMNAGEFIRHEDDGFHKLSKGVSSRNAR